MKSIGCNSSSRTFSPVGELDDALEVNVYTAFYN